MTNAKVQVYKFTKEVCIVVGTKNSKTTNYSGKLNSASTLEQPSHLAP